MVFTCNKCKLELDSSCFSKCNSNKRGLQYTCKSCKISLQVRYRETAEGKLVVQRDNKTGKHRKRKYAASEQGKMLHRICEAKRRAIKLNATPTWAELDDIAAFYKNCPEGYHVDHIIPLKGVNVCGLHVLSNLQYLTAEDNIRKGNRWHPKL